MAKEQNTYPQITLFNTASRTLEVFKPILEGKVGVYSCGPTVYYDAHIGNMRSFLFADVLKRVFTYAGYDVTHVMNITDVGHLTDDGDMGEDKMLVAMRREGLNAWDIAKRYTTSFLAHSKLLNILPHTHMPKATDHIQEQIEMVKTLEEKGYTYKTEDGVYFDTSKFTRYADLARLDVEGLRGGERVDLGDKKAITDFALWKFSPQESKRDMEWPSPWGVGFPGWHIECSAMAKKYLGEHFDIHTGGIDHIPVHHTNEVAQSECTHGHKYVNYWMHGAFLVLKNKDKMSKSSGNFFTMNSFLEEGVPAIAYRYFCLMAHYRMELRFDMDAVKAAATGYRRLCEKVQKYAKGVVLKEVALSTKAQEYQKAMEDALFEDLNTARALAHFSTLLDDKALKGAEKAKLADMFDAIFGLDLLTYKEEAVHAPAEVEALLVARNAARKERNFAEADRLRDAIAAKGFVIEDGPEGSVLKRG